MRCSSVSENVTRASTGNVAVEEYEEVPCLAYPVCNRCDCAKQWCIGVPKLKLKGYKQWTATEKYQYRSKLNKNKAKNFTSMLSKRKLLGDAVELCVGDSFEEKLKTFKVKYETILLAQNKKMGETEILKVIRKEMKEKGIPEDIEE